MRLLLDTHALVWAMSADRRLPAAVTRLILDPQNDVFYSVVSIFETAVKRSSGRRGAPALSAARMSDLAEAAGYSRLDITPLHAIAVETLAPFHPDPFDKLLLAQAQVEGLRLLTHDAELASYDRSIILF